jgi:penicillin-binding protein 2
LEALCEPLLRGTRGRVERFLGDEDGGPRTVRTLDARPGTDISTTIDIGLQQEVLALFQHAPLKFDDDTTRRESMHGGAVLIDVPTGEVLALVSAPTFDPNALDETIATLLTDQLNKPLLNRATQYPLETGSTIKPVVGLGGVTQAVIGVNEGVECTGYAVFGSRKLNVLRCWTASKFAESMPSLVAHHQIPIPHQGHDGNADGFLTLSDALERSCNVYFEQVAHRLGIAALSHWMEQFGLGRPTGIGIPESSGRLPGSYRGNNVKYATWAAGIGQGPVAATPIQMANVAATIARDGVWLRPSLIPRELADTQLRPIARAQAALDEVESNATTQPDAARRRRRPINAWFDVPDRVDLNLSRDALAATKRGMLNVVNSEAGTGRTLRLENDVVLVAGKTGTAQAAVFTEPDLDERGVQKRDERGRPMRRALVPSSSTWMNPRAPWYVAYDADGKNLKHSWIIGYAPARGTPRVAFAVMVEYGGSGGVAAAGIARGMLDACVQHGYLSPDPSRGGEQTTTSLKLDDTTGAH